MRGDRQERSETMVRRVRRRVSRSPDPYRLRSPEEIRAQYEAARAFAGEVTRMLPTSHQYTAGQAAALAWLLEQGPPPLTFDPGIGGDLGDPGVGEDPTPEAIVRLSVRARELMDGRDELFPPAYAMGVDYVCEWVQGRTEMLPIPRAEGPRAT